MNADKTRTYQCLKERHRKERDGYSNTLSLRVHRALSWLQRAEMEMEDMDAQFIFLWIAFNSAYATEIHDFRTFSERKSQMMFLSRLLMSDADNLLYQIVWDEFPKSIRLLIDNQYVYQPFWEYQKGKLTENQWRDQFRRDKAIAHRAFGNMQTKKVLAIIFDRLYVLRNQLIHGGATWNSKVNREQMRDGARLMAILVPTVVHIMMDNGHELWGDAAFPVVE